MRPPTFGIAPEDVPFRGPEHSGRQTCQIGLTTTKPASSISPYEAYAYRRGRCLPGGGAALLIAKISNYSGCRAQGDAKTAAESGWSVAHSRPSATSGWRRRRPVWLARRAVNFDHGDD